MDMNQVALKDPMGRVPSGGSMRIGIHPACPQLLLAHKNGTVAYNTS